jgi:hypothetical protein
MAFALRYGSDGFGMLFLSGMGKSFAAGNVEKRRTQVTAEL